MGYRTQVAFMDNGEIHVRAPAQFVHASLRKTKSGDVHTDTLEVAKTKALKKNTGYCALFFERQVDANTGHAFVAMSASTVINGIDRMWNPIPVNRTKVSSYRL